MAGPKHVAGCATHRRITGEGMSSLVRVARRGAKVQQKKSRSAPTLRKRISRNVAKTQRGADRLLCGFATLREMLTPCIPRSRASLFWPTAPVRARLDRRRRCAIRRAMRPAKRRARCFRLLKRSRRRRMGPAYRTPSAGASRCLRTRLDISDIAKHTAAVKVGPAPATTPAEFLWARDGACRAGACTPLTTWRS